MTANKPYTPDNKIGRYMVGAGCIMQHQPSGKILCLQRSESNFQGEEWEIMYGRIDQHEELEDALRREVKEETGISDFEIKKLLRVWHFYRGEKKAENEIFGFTFLCHTTSQEVKISAEHAQYRWVTPQEALDMIKVEGIREDVRFFLENKSDQIAFSGINNKIEHIY